MYYSDTKTVEWVVGKTYYVYDLENLSDRIEYEDEDYDEDEEYSSYYPKNIVEDIIANKEEALSWFKSYVDNYEHRNGGLEMYLYNNKFHITLCDSWEFNDGDCHSCDLALETLERAKDVLLSE